MRSEVLDKWYPMSMDTVDGGFLTSFTYDFKVMENQDKMIVTQARHTWTNAKAAELYPQVAWYKTGAHHGFEFLRDKMWDHQYGGFYSLVNREGNPKEDAVQGEAGKNAYGNAFGIYACAAYYKESGDTAGLNLAKKAFWWLEAHSHDAVRKGYVMYMSTDGTPLSRKPDTPPNSALGYKDQNSSIHILEALTELYKVWPDTLVKNRLDEMLHIVRDVLVGTKGYLTLFVYPDWTPVSFRDSARDIIMKRQYLDEVSFGHNIETAYLMLEAADALGMKDDPATLKVSKQLVDHTIENGWDDSVGGFYDAGYYFKGADTITIIEPTKNWWAQAEGLNSLLMMADLFPNDPHHYYDLFKRQWNYIDTYLIDHEHGDWYSGGLDKDPGQKLQPKGNIWKGVYHHFRALMNVTHRLRHPEDTV